MKGVCVVRRRNLEGLGGPKYTKRNSRKTPIRFHEEGSNNSSNVTAAKEIFQKNQIPDKKT